MNESVTPNDLRDHYYEVTENILIEVRPFFIPEKSSRKSGQFFYAYKIKITNHNDYACQLIQRHWKIKDGNGKTYDVQGPGVVGEKPVLPPGDSFEYHSFCPLKTPHGNMRGKFQFIDENRNSFWASVPVFFFRPDNEFGNKDLSSRDLPDSIH